MTSPSSFPSIFTGSGIRLPQFEQKRSVAATSMLQQGQSTTPFTWRWNIIFISVFLCIADWVYFYALSDPDSMISIVSMIRRSNVLVTFAAGALFFHEKNLKNKAIDLLLVLIGMIFLYLGTR